MNNTSRVAATLLTAAIGSILTSCAAADPAATTGLVATHHNTSSQTGATSPAPATSSGPTNPAGAETTKPEDQMRITITIGNQQFQATLDDSAASRDLLAQLPATLRMDDHAGVEKTGTLPTHCPSRVSLPAPIPTSATSGTTRQATTSSCTTAT